MMAAIKWDDGLSLGIPAIDEDHKKLIGYYNDLLAACFASVGPSVINRTLSKLIDYTHEHFSREEQLMSGMHYPDYLAHCAEHAALLLSVSDLKKNASSNLDHEISNDTLVFLRSWFIDHVLGSDLALAKFLQRGAPR